MKVNRNGTATPMSDKVYKKLRREMQEENHQLLLDIAYYTGERWLAILQLQVDDVYLEPRTRKLSGYITFRASTRKGRDTRQLPVHEDLQLRLRAYQPPESGYLFPSPVAGKHLSWSAADKALRRAIARAGLEKMGYSTYSTRRGFITQLHDKGVAIRTIQSLTGHKSLAVLSRYIEVTETMRTAAIASL